MPTLTWHGHSTFTLRTEESTILFDPWLDDNPSCTIGKDDITELDYILVSHGHFDHFTDCVPLAKKTGATVISTFEVTGFCTKQGVANVHEMNIGGGHQFPFGRVKLTPAVHTGTLKGDDEGAFTTDCSGFLLTLNEGPRVYFAGDTALMMDMQLLRGQVDLAILPIGDNYTMGPEDAVRAVDFIQPQTVIPMHYNTFELIAQDPQAFRDAVGELAKVEILQPGGAYEF